VLVVVVVISSLVIYLYSVPAVNRLSIVDETQALKLIPFYYNSTYRFSSGATQWLVALQMSVYTPSSLQIATLYLFKVAGDAGKNVAILGFDPHTNVTGYFNINFYNTLFQSNVTIVTIDFALGQAGGFSMDFGLQVQVYSSLLFLPTAQEKLRVPINIVAHYG
jgi:hypothetical protein